jgi:SET domain
VPPAETEIRRSAIAGHGVFARADLPPGTVVAGPLNHSCDPDTWFCGEVLVTRREVAAGEELTYDYATGATGFTLVCHCGTYRCRQLVAGDDWQIPQLQRRYAGHWAPRVQQLIDASG